MGMHSTVREFFLDLVLYSVVLSGFVERTKWI